MLRLNDRLPITRCCYVSRLFGLDCCNFCSTRRSTHTDSLLCFIAPLNTIHRLLPITHLTRQPFFLLGISPIIHHCCILFSTFFGESSTLLIYTNHYQHHKRCLPTFPRPESTVDTFPPVTVVSASTASTQVVVVLLVVLTTTGESSLLYSLQCTIIILT